MTHQYERVATPSSGLRLHLSENTAGCSPAVLEALQSLTREQVAFYPDYDAPIAATAAHLGVPQDRLLLTNGLDEGILLASIAALRGAPASDPFEGIIVVPAFDMYAACIDAAGGRVVSVPVEPDFGFPLERVLAAGTARTRLVFLTNPNNPTGQTIPRRAIVAVAGALPQATIFVDEAYADFAGETLLGDPVLDEQPNLVVGRTFAKSYGLAGLRAGALVGSPDTLAPLRRIVPPYTLNVAAAVALPAAIADAAYYNWYLQQVRESKALFYAAFDRLGIGYWKSAANFVLARFGGDSRRIIDGLAARQVYVRDRSAEHGCAGCARIAAGVVDHTRTCIAALEEVLCDVA
jgi:histidinol-phosphate aminotransferase